MSATMASMCRGKVTVMDMNIKRDSTGRVKQAGIWGETEFPRLRREGRTTSIDAIGEYKNADTSITWENWWTIDRNVWGNEDSKPAELVNQ